MDIKDWYRTLCEPFDDEEDRALAPNWFEICKLEMHDVVERPLRQAIMCAILAPGWCGGDFLDILKKGAPHFFNKKRTCRVTRVPVSEINAYVAEEEDEWDTSFGAIYGWLEGHLKEFGIPLLALWGQIQEMDISDNPECWAFTPVRGGEPIIDRSTVDVPRCVLDQLVGQRLDHGIRVFYMGIWCAVTLFDTGGVESIGSVGEMIERIPPGWQPSAMQIAPEVFFDFDN